MRTRIATANLYQHNPHPAAGVQRLINAIKPWGEPDSIGCQETRLSANKLRNVRGYHAFFRAKSPSFEHSNTVLVNDRRRNIKYHQYKGCEGIHAKTATGWDRTAPIRTIDVVTYAKGKHRFAHINTHFHVVPEETLSGKPESAWPLRARQYKRQVQRVIRIAQLLKSQGHIVYVTADQNARPRGNQNWEWSAYYALQHKGGMHVTRNGVDIVAWFPGQCKDAGTKKVPKHLTGSDDHDAIVKRFVIR